MKATILVAHDRNLLIGRSDTNSLPWHLPQDLRLFKSRTLNHAVIMGMNTFNSLPKKPLPNRKNFVVSRSLFPQCTETIMDNGAVIATKCGSLELAISIAQNRTYEGNVYVEKEVFIIGGAQIYKHALEKNLVNKVIVSLVHDCYQGDIFFPRLGDQWKCETEEMYADFDVLVYTKLS